VNLADAADFFVIAFVELAGADRAPMAELPVPGAADPALALKNFRVSGVARTWS
jgi:hypothetical protein